MRVALIGYGKMGKIIGKLLLERNHRISFTIDQENQPEIHNILPDNTDICIEFTGPDSAFENLSILIKNKLPVVCGSTGWYDRMEQIRELVIQHDTSFVAASNFSIGVNLFFEAAQNLATIMKNHLNYNVSINETHHTEKLDAPSGTAITLSEEVRKVMDRYTGYSLNEKVSDDQIPVFAFREENVPGTHELTFKDEIDEITLRHVAFNRTGFALGAVVAAEYIVDKKGVFTIREILKLLNH